MSRMRGLTGHNDVLGLLAGTSVPLAEDWFQCRSHLMSSESNTLHLLPPDLRNSEPLRGWLLDDCPKLPGRHYARYFFELDAWSEYWDIYHPETHGRYYFGDGEQLGYLSSFLPSPTKPRNPAFDSWKRMVLSWGGTADAGLLQTFRSQVHQPKVEDAVIAVDELVCRLVREHFSTSTGSIDALAYLDAMERFGRDSLPESPDRFERIPNHDARKSTSLHHTIEGHIMWFAWAMHLECVEMVAGRQSPNAELWPLLMAGIALGTSFDFAFRKRCRTRSEYLAGDSAASSRIWSRALELANDFDKGVREMKCLFRIREYGE